MLKKSMLVLMTLVMSFTFIAPSASQASSAIKEENKNQLVEKADAYIYLDRKSETFKVQKEAKDYLTSKELKEVKKILAKTNSEVKAYRSDLVIEGDKFSLKQEEENNEGFQTYAIDKSKDFDIDYTWWGMRIYWSHDFVEKLRANLVVYGGSVAALNATIAYFISPPGWVTSFVAAVAGIGVGAFISRDKGCGVYLDCYVYVPTAWYSAC